MIDRIPVAVAPLEEEIAPFVDRIGGVAEHRSAELTAWSGQLGDCRIVAATIGDGAGAAERGLSHLLTLVEPARLLLIGVAGGLSDDLGVGAIVGAQAVRTTEGGPLVPTGGPIDRIELGTVVTAERIVSTAEAKRDLWHEIGRPARCVVDVESHGVVERMEHRGVPWTVVRAVIDPADEDLPLDFGALSDAEGQVVRSRVLWHLLRRPVAMKGILELRARVRSCAVELAGAAERWLGQ